MSDWNDFFSSGIFSARARTYWIYKAIQAYDLANSRDWLLKWAGELQKALLKVLRGAVGEQNKAKERKPPILRGAQNCSPIAIKESD